MILVEKKSVCQIGVYSILCLDYHSLKRLIIINNLSMYFRMDYHILRLEVWVFDKGKIIQFDTIRMQ